ncbi:glycine/betaine ABC transporter substrate-binding protein [Paraphotobacterium marinum]|uniref:Glycine/betaine ABC transporter substrate-binding protein n=1 Tax=Paraphotobacterium marinum TaxID=1755811 RepID=A0A220VGI5_9GAMM|nr:glycine/betaine ABC transporter substrate-binding protein [Paraphotobacterium marinum]
MGSFIHIYNRLLLLLFLKNTNEKNNKTVVVASKNFTEQYILGNIIALMLEKHTGLKVEKKINLGSTDIVTEALKKGAVDIYPEYTGTGLLTVLKQPFNPKLSSQDIYNTVNKGYEDKYGITWLEPLGFYNSQTLAISKAIASKFGVYKLSQLKLVESKLKLAVPSEFLLRKDGFPNYKKVYDLNIPKSQIKLMEPNLMYQAFKTGIVNTILVFTTDGQLSKYAIVPLEDDRHINPPYDAAIVAREAILKKHPEIKCALKPLNHLITNKVMQSLNYQVDIEKKSPLEVARTFLEDKGLLSINLHCDTNRQQ